VGRRRVEARRIVTGEHPTFPVDDEITGDTRYPTERREELA